MCLCATETLIPLTHPLPFMPGDISQFSSSNHQMLETVRKAVCAVQMHLLLSSPASSLSPAHILWRMWEGNLAEKSKDTLQTTFNCILLRRSDYNISSSKLNSLPIHGIIRLTHTHNPPPRLSIALHRLYYSRRRRRGRHMYAPTS